MKSITLLIPFPTVVPIRVNKIYCFNKSIFPVYFCTSLKLSPSIQNSGGCKIIVLHNAFICININLIVGNLLFFFHPFELLPIYVSVFCYWHNIKLQESFKLVAGKNLFHAVVEYHCVSICNLKCEMVRCVQCTLLLRNMCTSLNVRVSYPIYEIVKAEEKWCRKMCVEMEKRYIRWHMEYAIMHVIHTIFTCIRNNKTPNQLVLNLFCVSKISQFYWNLMQQHRWSALIIDCDSKEWKSVP